MLSYLNAKTLNERKRLVPAVSAVLCLTAEETAAGNEVCPGEWVRRIGWS
jgi:hypothetical protein